MSIYVNFEIPKTPEEFLLKLYSLISYDRADCVATYFNKEGTLPQCRERKYRSFDDLFELFTTYYSKITEKDLIRLLTTANIKTTNGQQLYLHVANCSGIGRIRIVYYNNIDSCTQSFNCEKYYSKYSWVDLYKLIGINSGAELKQYMLNNIK